MVYIYQLIAKSVLLYTLMEGGGLVIEMLLMLSGDIESNPGPSEYLSTYIIKLNLEGISKLIIVHLAC